MDIDEDGTRSNSFNQPSEALRVVESVPGAAQNAAGRRDEQLVALQHNKMAVKEILPRILADSSKHTGGGHSTESRADGI